MEAFMEEGVLVEVVLFGGALAKRRVVQDCGKLVVVCTEGEYEKAKSEGRLPEGIGFPRADVKELRGGK
jgi:hypothetical protein